MTHHDPGGNARLVPPLATLAADRDDQRPPARPCLGIDREQLRAGIAERRAALAALETAMVARCEAAAGRGAQRHVRLDERETWDRAMWNRYLSAAASLEPAFLPRMLRLHAEVESLERLLLLPEARGARAA